MDVSSLLNIVTAAVVVASPLLTSLFTHTGMTARTKNTIAMIVSLAIAVGYEAMTGGITDWTNVMYAFPVVYGLQQAVYNALLKAVATNVETNVGVTAKVEPVTAVEAVPVAPVAPVYETPAMG